MNSRHWGKPLATWASHTCAVAPWCAAAITLPRPMKRACLNPKGPQGWGRLLSANAERPVPTPPGTPPPSIALLRPRSDARENQQGQPLNDASNETPRLGSSALTVGVGGIRLQWPAAWPADRAWLPEPRQALPQYSYRSMTRDFSDLIWREPNRTPNWQYPVEELDKQHHAARRRRYELARQQ